MGLSQMANEQTDQAGAGHVETKFGKFQVGSFLSYQVVLTESHFKATSSINCILRLNQVNNKALNYPRFPLLDIDSVVIPDNLCETDPQVLKSLTLDEDEINELETHDKQGNKLSAQNGKKRENSDLQHHSII